MRTKDKKINNFTYPLKRLKWVGRILMLLGLMFVIKQLWVVRADLIQDLDLSPIWPILLIFPVVYGLSELLLPLGWLFLLRAQGPSRLIINWAYAWRLYGKAQIAKYIPGNVFHIAGRHLIANEKGVRHEVLVMAAVLEIILLITAALLLSLIMLGSILWTTKLPSFFIPVGVASGLMAALIFALARGYWPFLRKKVYFNRFRLAAALLFYTLFLIVACLLFFSVLALISDDRHLIFQQWPLIFGGYCFSWLAGFIVPGAPGGLGIRESMLLALLETSMPGPRLLVGILVFRIINVLGDLFFYLIACFCGRAYKKQDNRLPTPPFSL